MHVRSLIIGLSAVVVSLTVVPARAQAPPAPAAPPPSPWVVVAGVGYGSIYDDEGSLGAGLDLSAGVGRRLNGTWSIEGVAFRQAHERRDAYRIDGEAVGGVARIVAHVGSASSRSRLFLAAGVGVVRHSGTRGFVGGPPEAPVLEDTVDFATTGMVTEVATGLEIAGGPRWFVRPEVRARWSSVDRPRRAPEPPYLGGLVGVTLGWRP